MTFIQDDGSITTAATRTPLPPEYVAAAAMWSQACREAIWAIPRPMGDSTGGDNRYAYTVVRCAREIIRGFAQKERE